MDIAAEHRSHLVAFRRFFIYATDPLWHGIDRRIPELVSSCLFTRSQPAFHFRFFGFDVADFRQALLHTGVWGKDARHGPTARLGVDDRFRQIHEAATFRIDRRTVRGEFRDGGSHGPVRR